MTDLTAPLPPAASVTAQAADRRLVDAMATAGAKGGADKISTVARDFEAMMLTQALQSMFEGVSTEGAFGGGYAEEVYRGMMLDAVARSIADRGGLGIAPQVEQQIKAYNLNKGA